MKTFSPDPNDDAAVGAARAAIDQRIVDQANVTMVIRGDVAAFAERARLKEEAGAGRAVIWLKTAASEVLGDREARWFGTNGACAVALRGDDPRMAIPASSNGYRINRAFLAAEG